MSALEQHQQKIRALHHRLRACEESGNESGAERIQQMIDDEHQRFECQSNQTDKKCS